MLIGQQQKGILPFQVDLISSINHTCCETLHRVYLLNAESHPPDQIYPVCHGDSVRQHEKLLTIV